MTLQIESPNVYTQLGVAVSVTGIAQVKKKYTKCTNHIIEQNEIIFRKHNLKSFVTCKTLNSNANIDVWNLSHINLHLTCSIYFQSLSNFFK